MVKGLVAMMNKEDFTGPVNLGNPTEFTIVSLANRIVKLTESKSKIVFNALPSDDPVQRQPDISLAKARLNWVPSVEIEEGLQKTIDYFKGIIG
jgi:UDP-glucuronate decarboxylase